MKRGFDYSKGKGTYTDTDIVRIDNREYRKTDTMSIDVRKSYLDTGNSLFGIAGGVFKIVLLLLLMVAIMKVTLGSSQTLTFTAFLQGLRDAPTIDVSGIRTFVEYGASLRAIPIIGGALEFLVNIVSVVAYGAIGIVQVIRYFVYFIGFIF